MKGQQGCPGQGDEFFDSQIPLVNVQKPLVFQDAVDQKYQHGIPNAFVGAIVLQMRTGQGKKLDIQVCISSVQHGKTYCFDGDAAVW